MESDPDQQALTAVISKLKQDITLMGIIALGKDGVLRTLDADRNVLDAVGLSPNLIEAYVLRATGNTEMMSGVYKGVDGSQASKETWYHPEDGILPPPMSAEDKEESRRLMAEDPERYEDMIKKLKKNWEEHEQSKSC